MAAGERPSRDRAEAGGETRVLVIRSRHFGWVGLRATLEGMSEVRIVGEVASWPEGMSQAREAHPDVVMAASDKLEASPQELVSELRGCSPGSRIIVLAEEATHTLLLPGERAIEGYLLWRNVTSEALRIALAAVVAGGLHVMSPGAVEELIAPPEHRRWRDGAAALTEQEWRVLRSLTAGRTESEIAQAEHMSIRSVQGVVRALRAKLGARTLFLLGMRASGLGLGSS